MARPAFMRLAFKKILSELILAFMVCLGSLLALILVGRLVQMRDLFLGQSLGFLDIAEIFAYLSPFFLMVLMPIACMLSVFLTFLRMSTDREIVALKSGGVSLYQLLPAPIIFCLGICLLNGVIAFQGLSWGMEKFREKAVSMAKSQTQLLLQPGVFNHDIKGLTLFTEHYDPRTSEMRLVFISDERGKDGPVAILAPKGRLGIDPGEGQLLLVLEDGRIYREDPRGQQILSFGTYMVRVDMGALVSGYNLGKLKPKEMSFAMLMEMAKDAQTVVAYGGNFARKVQVELQKRLVLPIACLVLGLFALPFACAFEGLKQYLGLVCALGLFMVYYTLLSVAMNLGEAGTLNPEVGMWLPNVIFSLIGLGAIHLTAQEKTLRIMDRASYLLAGLIKTRKEPA